RTREKEEQGVQPGRGGQHLGKEARQLGAGHRLPLDCLRPRRGLDYEVRLLAQAEEWIRLIDTTCHRMRPESRERGQNPTYRRARTSYAQPFTAAHDRLGALLDEKLVDVATAEVTHRPVAESRQNMCVDDALIRPRGVPAIEEHYLEQ